MFPILNRLQQSPILHSESFIVSVLKFTFYQCLVYIVFGLVTNAGNEFFTLANSVNANINTRSRSHV